MRLFHAPSARCSDTAHVDAQHVGCNEIGARGIHFFTDAERTRERTAARVHDRSRVRIVVIEPMREDAVEQHGVTQW
jgi:hypothetical protein